MISEEIQGVQILYAFRDVKGSFSEIWMEMGLGVEKNLKDVICPRV
jgi:hypothetical protein